MASDKRFLPSGVSLPRRLLLLPGAAVLRAPPLVQVVMLEEAESTSAAMALLIRSFSLMRPCLVRLVSAVQRFALWNRLRPLTAGLIPEG